MPPAAAYGFWTLALVAQVINRYAQSFSFAAFGIPSSQFPMSGVCFPAGPAGTTVYATFPITELTFGFSTLSDASAGQVSPNAACPVAISRERSAASVASAPGSLTALSGPVKNFNALRVSGDFRTTFQWLSKMLPPNARKIGDHSEMTGLPLAPRMVNP